MAKLDFGECNDESGHSTNVNLNGIEIGVATSGQLSKTIDVNFKDGDILELKQKNYGSLIRFNSFTVIICCQIDTKIIEKYFCFIMPVIGPRHLSGFYFEREIKLEINYL